jgi:ATP-binding cassette subfamily B protein
MSDPWASLTWRAEQLPEGLEQLARHSGLPASAGRGMAAVSSDGQGRIVEWAAARLGLEAAPVEAEYAELGSFLEQSPPLIVRRGERYFLLGRGLAVLCGDGRSEKPRRDELVGLLGEEIAAEARPGVERVLERADLRGAARERARQALLGEVLHGKRVGGCWLLRPGVGVMKASTADTAVAPAPRATAVSTVWTAAGLRRWLAGFVGGMVGEYVFWLSSWWLLGWLSLGGRFDSGWLAAWVLLLFSTVPCRLIATLSAGQLAVRGGALFKQHLLAATLHKGGDEVRRQGVGQVLGRVLEAETIETHLQEGAQLLGTGSLEALLALFVLTMAGLSVGGPGWLPAGLLVLTLLGQVALTRRYLQRRREWTRRRLDLTHELVERMVGHRTRLAQQPRDGWHEEEDRDLVRYLESSRRQDRLGTALLVVGPRGFLVLGLLGLGAAFMAGAAPVSLAVAVGGVVLANRAFRFLAEAAERLATAWLAWEHVRDLARGSGGAGPASLPGGTETAQGKTVMEVRNIVYTYPGRPAPVLDGVSLRIRAGERLLIEGPSGSGKSTLAAILAGVRQPQAGLVLLGGLGREVVGEDGWRSRVVIAPPFHDNHILQGTLAFNLLMGRGWPPAEADLREAERICRGLELGPLLEQMPGGLLQLVGETGWQLSHGERSRVFLARALLQGAEVLILDESFAALDPPTLERALRFVRQEAKTLIVIAHP